jgi:hypothetical protein
MRKVAILFDGVYLDLFGDEEITLTRKATDYRDLGKVYTDFTQTFTVPATPNNNKALKHYYNMTVLNGFNQSENVSGRIEVDTLPVRSGVFIVEGAKLKNGLPVSYNLVFYGDLKSLKDTFGDDKLEDLDLSTYDHAHNFTNVEISVEGAGLSSGAVYYPLISPVRKWYYNSNSSEHGVNNIAYHTGHSSNEHGIWHYELKPALQLAKIIDAIEAKYSITFTSTFFASSAFTDLYLWLHRNEGYMPQVPAKLNWTNKTTSTAGYDDNYDLSTNTFTAPDTGSYFFRLDKSSLTPLLIEIRVNDEIYYRAINEPASGGLHDFYIDLEVNDTVNFYYATTSINTELAENCSFTIETQSPLPFRDISIDSGATDQTFAYTYAQINRIIPDVKVYDFMTYIMKLFNLVVYPIDSITFEVEPYSDWIGNNTHDISRYVDIGDIQLSKSSIYNNIEFKHKEPGTAAGKLYAGTFGDGFGNLSLDLNYRDADTFEVQSGFEMPIFERLFDADDDTATDISFAYITEDASDDPSPYLGGLWLLYYQDKATSLTKSFNLLTAAGGDNEVTAYHRFGISNDSSLSSNTLSLAFGASIDPYFGGQITRGLYNEYYKDQINALYDSRTRITDVEAVLPLSTIVTLQMNDYIVIGDLKFSINELKINLNTGRTKMKLINVVA